MPKPLGNTSSRTAALYQSYWTEQYQNAEALWIHSGDSRQPHALLTSGMHSNGFFNSKLIIARDTLMHDAATDLVDLLLSVYGVKIEMLNGIVGPQTGATKMAEYLSKEIAKVTGRGCFNASPAKHEENGVKSMVFSPEEQLLIPEQNVLLCEDVCTTGGSIGLTANAIAACGGTTLPFVLVLVNRSGMSDIDGRKIIALINEDMPIWNANECPLCKAGSNAIRPKETGNWALLNATY
ncbi:MAG: phosphoribosyltransferase family protein [Minisyncoccia bacterium]